MLFDSPCLLFSCFTNAVSSGIFFGDDIFLGFLVIVFFSLDYFVIFFKFLGLILHSEGFPLMSGGP